MLGDLGVMQPAHPLRRAAALALDAVVVGSFLAWLLLPVPDLSPWAALALVGLYAVAGEGLRGHTLGKKAMALEVRSAADGQAAGLRRALVRFAARAAPVATMILAWTWGAPAVARLVTWLGVAALLLDHLWPVRSRLGRTLHDLAAGTVVLHRPRARLFRLEESRP